MLLAVQILLRDSFFLEQLASGWFELLGNESVQLSKKKVILKANEKA